MTEPTTICRAPCAEPRRLKRAIGASSVLAAAFLLPTATAVGLGIGEQSAVSHLFEPLMVEIPVELGGLPADSVNVALRIGDVGASGVAEGLRREIVTGRDGRAYLRVSSRAVIREPALVLNVDLSSGAIRVRRELTLLFDPATGDGVTQFATTASPAVAPPSALPPKLTAPQDADEAALTALIEDARRASSKPKAATAARNTAAKSAAKASLAQPATVASAQPPVTRRRAPTLARPGLRMATHLSLGAVPVPVLGESLGTATVLPAHLKTAARLSSRSLELVADALIRPATAAADLPAAKPAAGSAASAALTNAAPAATVGAAAAPQPAAAVAAAPSAATAATTQAAAPAAATEGATAPMPAPQDAQLVALAAAPAAEAAIVAKPVAAAPAAVVPPVAAEPETPYGVLAGVLAAAAIAFGGLLKALAPAPAVPRRRRDTRAAASREALEAMEPMPAPAPAPVLAAAAPQPARAASRPLELDGSAPLSLADPRPASRDVRPLDFVVPEPVVAPAASVKPMAKVAPDWSPEDFDLLAPLDHDHDRRG